ncbi:MAG: hypothetical protein M1835_000514 [Candelina submexicana]|nr:MAG: hypothetical protein M1835_000514 [Candelina submexicana]
MTELDNGNYEIRDDGPMPMEEWDFYFFDPDSEGIHNYEPEGYHPVHFGDLLCSGRYRIIHKLGFGSFSTVWLARDTTVEKPKYVALKIIVAELRGQSSELKVLQHLARQPSNDPGLSHLLGLSDHFEEEGPNGLHDVLVLEVVGPSLKDVHYLLNVRLIKTMAFQVISAIACLHRCGVGHGDLHPGNVAIQMTDLNDKEPDDILTLHLGYPSITPVLTKDPKRTTGSLPKYVVRPPSFEKYVANQSERQEFHWHAKIMDFGESFFQESRPEHLATPLVFRAPEVIFNQRSKGEINIDWDYRSDLWALGCFIFELVFNRPLFTSSDDEEFLIYEMTGIAGPLPTSWAPYWDSSDRLDENGSPLNVRDKSWRTSLADTVKYTQLTRDLAGFDDKSKSELANLLSQILIFEPEKRKSADELLKHPWFDGCINETVASTAITSSTDD